MTVLTRLSDTRTRAILLSAAIIAGLVFTAVSGGFLRPHLTADWILSTPYMRSALISLVDAGVLFALVWLAAWTHPGRIAAITGLGASPIRPLMWAGAVFLPALIICVALVSLSDASGPADYGWLVIGGPVIEEIVYRGLAVGVLVRLAGWHWLPAVILPGIVFGLVHAGAGTDPMEIAGIVAITGLGGLLFGWLFVRWGFNLWPAILLHVGLNGLWTAFALGENAIGDLFANGVRVGTVILAIGLTFVLAPKPRRED
ncbi:CPBP family glutamic-type intramembrane protease [Glycocaulis abyssi]|uniref:Type II CAAX prenyl endopeptidase Rce1 family protein n=1 Tax=Glycocaulis abyssi TaxID=1433403 RepID=A0ABV9NAH0_9PROT